MENGPVEIVDFTKKNGDFPWQNVSSPEGIRDTTHFYSSMATAEVSGDSGGTSF